MNDTTLTEQTILNKSRDDKFLLVFDVPKLIVDLDKKERTNSTIQRDTMQFAIEGIVLPAISIPQVSVNYRGGTVAISSQARTPYDPVPITFTIDNRFNNYWVFYTWLNAIRSVDNGLYATALEREGKFDPSMFLPDYAVDMTVYVKDEYNVDIMKYTYESALPIRLSEVNWNYKNGKEIQATATIAYSNILMELL